MPPSPGPAAGTPTADSTDPGLRATYRQMLGPGEFRVVFAADIVSMLGTVVAAVALTVLVYQRTDSPALAASVMALAFVPYLLGGILLGAAACRRLPARRMLVTCDLASAVLVAAMVIPGMPVAGLLILLFANGLIAPVYQGVRSAMLPEVPARPRLRPRPVDDADGRPVRADHRIRGRRAPACDPVTTRRAGRGRAVLRGLGHAAAVRHCPPASQDSPNRVDGTRFPGRRPWDLRSSADPAHPAVHLARGRVLGRARSARDPVRNSHRPACSRRGFPAHGNPGRHRASRSHRGPHAAPLASSGASSSRRACWPSRPWPRSPSARASVRPSRCW